MEAETLTRSTLLAPPRPFPARPVRPRPPRQAALEQAARRTLVAAETGFVVVSLFLFSQALVPLLVESSGTPTGGGAYEGNMTLRLMFSSIHAVTLALLAVHWRAGLASAARNRPALVLVALAVASVAWSADPSLTLRRSLAFLGTTAFGILLAARYDTPALLRRVAAAMGIAAVLSAGFALGLPRLGVDHVTHPGAWKGVYTEKNTLGQMMLLGALAFSLARSGVRRRWVGTLGAGACAVLLLLSTSKTALTVLVVLGVMAVTLLRTVRWHYKLAVPVVIGMILVAGTAAVWVAANLEPLLVSMGKDPTLTGRTPMWQALFVSISQRPLLGYGYSAFWLGHTGPSASALEAIGWETPGAHNGYLDTCLQLGLVGLVTLLLGLASAYVRSLRAVRTTRTSDGLWPALFLTIMLLYNFSETMLLTTNNVFWVLYVAVGCSWLLRREAAEDPAPAVAPGTGGGR